MEASSVVDRRPRRKKHQPHARTAHDNALIKAKIEKRDIGIVLAVSTPYSDEDGFCVVRICHVDKDAIEIEAARTGKRHWINKVFIVSTGDPDD